jgi:predicted transcriptional regulator
MTTLATPVVLLSVRSPHVERLLSGAKTVEFRRRPWRVPDGTTVLVYESRDRRAIVGSLVVESTAVGSRSAMWTSYGARSGLTRREYREYFAGASVAVAISVGRVGSTRRGDVSGVAGGSQDPVKSVNAGNRSTGLVGGQGRM